MPRVSKIRIFNPHLLVIPALVAFGAMTAAAPARAQVGIDVSVTVAPPELPVYEQPPLPGPGYIWTPGYWSYGDDGYFWVPGTWVEPPSVGLLWTPGYWGFREGRYLFNAGYWGPRVGFYGGINYGFGYGGEGYEGGEWRNGAFAYNRAVNNFGGVHITNVYVRNVTNVTVNRVSFNGPNGINRRPVAAELAAARERHIQATSAQIQHQQLARQDRELRASVNKGRPPITATSRPADFHPAAGNRPGQAETPRGRPDAAPVKTPGQAGRPGLAPHSATPNEARPAPAERPRPESRPTTAPVRTPGEASRPALQPHRTTPQMGGGEAKPMHTAPAMTRPAAEPRATMAPRAPAEPRVNRPTPVPHPEARPGAMGGGEARPMNRGPQPMAPRAAAPAAPKPPAGNKPEEKPHR